nr:hypothetical protein Iba_chr04cCG0270 [Ipomoea batatas]
MVAGNIVCVDRRSQEPYPQQFIPSQHRPYWTVVAIVDPQRRQRRSHMIVTTSGTPTSTTVGSIIAQSHRWQIEEMSWHTLLRETNNPSSSCDKRTDLRRSQLHCPICANHSAIAVETIGRCRRRRKSSPSPPHTADQKRGGKASMVKTKMPSRQ